MQLEEERDLRQRKMKGFYENCITKSNVRIRGIPERE